MVYTDNNNKALNVAGSTRVSGGVGIVVAFHTSRISSQTQCSLSHEKLVVM